MHIYSYHFNSAIYISIAPHEITFIISSTLSQCESQCLNQSEPEDWGCYEVGGNQNARYLTPQNHIAITSIISLPWDSRNRLFPLNTSSHRAAVTGRSKKYKIDQSLSDSRPITLNEEKDNP